MVKLNTEIQYLKGDLVKAALFGYVDVLVHGCNCFNNMGAGIAKQIRIEIPEAYQADLRTKKGSPAKLGTYSQATRGELTVVNAYTQFYYGRQRMHADYVAIRKVMTQVNRDFKGQRIGLPLIGAGLAGGDWKVIEQILKETLTDVDVVIYEFTPKGN